MGVDAEAGGDIDIGTMFGAGKAQTFLGLPYASDVDALGPGAAIVGVPVMTPYRSVGSYCAGAPRAIRDAIAPYAANLHHVDFDVGGPIFPDRVVSAVDLGDLPYHEHDFAANRRALERLVQRARMRGAVPIVIGGDDSVPIPLFAALAGGGEFSVVQIDAHIDWRDDVDGERFGLSSNMRRASEMAHITRIVQLGQRGIGSARERDYRDALDWGVEFIPARELDGYDMSRVTNTLAVGEQVVIAIDIDGLDPSVVPGVIGRGPGGLSYWQCVNLIHGIAARARIAAFSLVEFMPERDVSGLGALVAARLIVNALAAVARQQG